MNNREAQSAAAPRAADSYLVDLTRVCVTSGTVRLPLSLLSRFKSGEHQVKAGDAELTLTFEAPRTLSGLSPFFEQAQLRANDRVRFLFRGEALELQAERRERKRRAAPADIAQGARGDQATDSPSRQQPRSALGRGEGGRLTGRGVSQAPATLAGALDDAPRRKGAADEAAANTEQSGGRVRRVRIEGGAHSRVDAGAPRPRDRASARDVWANRQRPSWRALDTTLAGPVVSPEEAAEAFSGTTVRVIRRSSGTSTPLSAQPPDEPVLGKPEEAMAVPERDAPAWPSRTRERAPSTLGVSDDYVADEAASGGERLEPPPFDPYLDAPIDAEREAGYTPPTILESDLLSIPGSGSKFGSGGRWRDESEAAYLKYQEGEGSGARAPRRPGLLERLGLARAPRETGEVSGGGRGEEEPRGSGQLEVPEWRAELGAPSTVQGGALEFGQGFIGEGFGDQSVAATELSAVAVLEREVDQVEVLDAPRRVLIDDAVLEMEMGGVSVGVLSESPANSGSLEDDMAALLGYFAEPDVPAIVRCDELAQRLNVEVERVERAMERLAEDRDRFTPLRGGAYMVRRIS